MYNKIFWKDAAERAISTAAQVMITIVGLYIPSVSLAGTGDFEGGVLFMIATLPYIVLAGLGGAALSILKSLAAAKKNGTDSASLSKSVADNTKY